MIAQVKKRMLKMYMQKQLKKEQVFTRNGDNLKYLWMSNKKSDKLLVVFSGFPLKNNKPSYNYVLKFRNLTCNKLFILDDFGSDARGSFYLGESKDFFIERLVHQLIEEKRAESGLSKENVITAGSSKGGYAAILFLLKYGYGSAIAGAPQYLLGDYLAMPGHEPIMKYIAGNDGEEGREFLNGVMKNVVQKADSTAKIYIHVSKNEHHYPDHVLPLSKDLDAAGISYELDLGEYTDHGEVGKYFPSFAEKIITTP